MRRAHSYLLASLFLLPFTAVNLSADGSPVDEVQTAPRTKVQPFTGKITRSKVRMRLGPSLDSPVVKELDRGEMVVVVDEADDFYGVRPPSGTKAYVYRTYVLEGVVEGNKVNVRLAPHLESPVIAQLNSGDRVDGTIFEGNSKWLEIDPPAATTFYVSNDFVEKLGDAGHLSRHEAKKEEISTLLNSTQAISETELLKPFTEIDSELIQKNFQKVISEAEEFPEEAKKAEEYLAKFKDAYLQKKVEYLEEKTKNTSMAWRARTDKLTEHSQTQQERLSHLEEKMQLAGNEPQTSKELYQEWLKEKFGSEYNARMEAWLPIELSYYEQWAEDHGNRSIEDFYKEQGLGAIAMKGILESYDRPVRNKPGDYLLINRANRLPIAYIYSTRVNLQDKLGQEITVQGVLRPNNNFAYPAYFILSAE